MKWEKCLVIWLQGSQWNPTTWSETNLSFISDIIYPGSAQFDHQNSPHIWAFTTTSACVYVAYSAVNHAYFVPMLHILNAASPHV